MPSQIFRCSSLGLVLMLSVATSAMSDDSPQSASQAGDWVLPPAKAYGKFSQARVEYGRYLALAGDCLGCHLRQGGQPFEGGLALETPFGAIYSPNITPSKTAGIGAFSDNDFLRALQHGIGPDGKPYYPALPYPAFTKVRDDELLAIKDYLFSLQPSNYQPPETQLRWPFDIRDLLFGWQELYLTDKRFEPNPNKSPEWNRGAYLVEGLGHCGSCHTPRNAAGATEVNQAWTGAVVDGWYAPNLTADLSEGIGEWTQKELVQYLRTGEAPPAQSNSGPQTAALGPMAEVVHLSLSQIADSDARAIAVYLKDLPAKVASRDTLAAAHQLSEQDDVQGHRLYNHYCAGCHQSHGQGLAPYFPALRGNEVVNLVEPNDVIMTVLLGAPSDPSQAYSKHVVMPSFGSLLSNKQVATLASYIRANWGNDAPPVNAEQVTRLRKGQD